MEPVKLVGVGYMGDVDRVTRMLDKVMESTRSAYDILEPLEFGNGCLSQKRSITGFCLGFADQSLRLSLFERSIGARVRKTNHCITRTVKHKDGGLH